MATSANDFPELRPPARFLLGPGPSNVHPRVMKAMLSPVLGHLDPEFVGIMEDIKKMLRLVFRTDNEITFPVSGTGSAGLECVMANLIEEGDDVVVGVNTDRNFLRRLAGHVENGRDSASDPAFGNDGHRGRRLGSPHSEQGVDAGMSN